MRRELELLCPGYGSPPAPEARDAYVLAHIWTEDDRGLPGVQLGDSNYHPSRLSSTSEQHHVSTSGGRRRCRYR